MTYLIIKVGAVVFHAGLKLVNDVLVSCGGRVVGVCATGETLGNVTKTAYDALEKIQFRDMRFRKDISSECFSVLADRLL
jgi:phosphoribosylamine-glycine ligase